MSGPELETPGDDEGDEVGFVDFDGVEEDETHDPVNDGPPDAVGTVDLGVDTGDDIISGFDGVEDDESHDEQEETPGSGGSSSGGGAVSVANAIEEGMAEVSVVGLRGQERKRVRGEMHAVASKFKLGYFGEQCAEKYLQRDLDDIPPEYGLAAAMIAFAAVALYKRPDGQEKVESVVATMRNKFNGDSGQPAPQNEQAGTEDNDE